MACGGTSELIDGTNGVSNKLNLVGTTTISSAKRACITAYTDQTHQPKNIAAAATTSQFPVVSLSQQQVIIQQAQPGHAFSTAYSAIPQQQQPMLSGTPHQAGGVLPIQFCNRVTSYVQPVSAIASTNNSTAARVSHFNFLFFVVYLLP